MIKMYKEFISLLQTFLPKAAAQAVPYIALALIIGWFGREIRDTVKNESLKTQLILKNDSIINNKLDYVIEVNAILIECINTLSIVEEKTNKTFSDMIREAAKKPANIPLIEKLEDDIKNANLELPHHHIKKDTTKYVIKAIKKTP